MKSNIKLRIWSPHLRSFWIKGLDFTSDGIFNIPGHWRLLLKSLQPKHVSQPIVQQFTGVRDSRKKEIYEGDIVSFSIDGKQFVKKVKLENGSFKPLHKLKKMKGLKVVGNIFENPSIS